MRQIGRLEVLPELIRDVCMKLVGHAHDNEVSLLLGTAAAESGFIFRKQLSDGPARGLWQMEPSTAQDIFENYLCFHLGRFGNLIQLWVELEYMELFVPSESEMENHLEHYDDFACAMARIHYLRDPAPIPESVEDQAEYWLRVYNAGGKGTIEHYLEMWTSCECEKLLNQ